MQVPLDASESEPKNRKTLSLNAYLFRLIWLCILPPILLSGYLGVDYVLTLWKRHDIEGQTQVQNIAKAIDQHLASHISALQVLAASPLLDTPLRLNEFYLQALSFRESLGGHIVLADLSSQMLLNTRVPFGASLPKLPTPKGHAAAPHVLNTGAPSVGDMFQGPIAKEPLVAIVVPVKRGHQMKYLLLSVIETRQFQQRLDDIALHTGWTLQVIDGKGAVMAQRSDLKKGNVSDARSPYRRIIIDSGLSPWSVVLEAPYEIYRAPIVTTSLAMLLAVLLAVIVSILGGRIASRRLSRSVAALAHSSPSNGHISTIEEIEEVHERLINTTQARDRAVDELKKHATLLERVMAVLPIGVWIIDETGKIVNGNEVGQRIWEGVRYVGMAQYGEYKAWWADTGNPITQEEWAAARAITRGESSIEEEIVIECFDGTRKTILNSAVPIYGAGRKISGAVVVNQDITERLRVDQALRESEQRLRSTLDNMMEGCQIIDFDWRYRYLNKAAEKHSRRPKEELLGKKFADIWPDTLSTPLYSTIRSCMEEQVSIHTENEFIFPDGQKGWFDLRIQPVPEGVFILSVDITTRKQTEAALKRSQILLNEAQRISKVGGWEYDVDTHRVTWTDEVYRIHCLSKDYDPSDPERDISFYTPEDRKKIAEVFDRAVVLGEPYDLELQMVDAEGKRKWIRTMGQPHIENGRTVRLSGNIMDITERKLAEAERERLIAAIEQAGEIVMVTDPAGVIQYVNPAFRRVTGYTPDEAIGQTPCMLQSGQHDERFYRTLWTTIKSGEIWKGRIINRRKDGELYTEAMNISPVKGQDGSIVNYVAVKRDITEHLLLESQFQQAQKMESVGRLAGGVAHDYNNILSVIIGYTELSLDEVHQGEPLYDNLKEILKAAHRSRAVTQQLLTFARKDTIEVEVLELNSAVESMLKMIHRLIGEDIDLEWRPGPGLWPVEVDPSQIDQILANLCVNARDSITNVGSITIETGNEFFSKDDGADRPDVLPGEFVMLAVSDDGCGMAPEIMSNIFEPFFTTKEIGRGTGLGLSTVFGIVKQNNGFIIVNSEPDKGTAFKIYLPRYIGETSGREEKAVDLNLQSKGETILVVEDEHSILRLTEQILLKYGYRVWTADTPAAALELAKTHDGGFSLLISDVIMPGMNGHELVEQLHAGSPDLKHLFMSGYTADVLSRSGALDSGEKYLQKPFSSMDLARKVRAALDRD